MEKIKLFGTFFTKSKDEAKFRAYFDAQDLFASEVAEAIQDLFNTVSPFTAVPGTLTGITKLNLSYDTTLPLKTLSTGDSTTAQYYTFKLNPVAEKDVISIINLRNTADPDKSRLNLTTAFSDWTYGDRIFFVKDGYIWILSDYVELDATIPSLKIKNVEIPVEKDGTNLYFTLYTDRLLLKTNVLFDKFGYYLGLPKREDSFDYLTQIKAVWKSLVEQKNLGLLKSAVAAFIGMPIAWEEGKVISSWSADGFDYVVIEHPNYGQVKYTAESLQTFSPGDSIAEFQVLSPGINIYYKNITGLVQYEPISRLLRSFPFESYIIHEGSDSYIPISRHVVEGNILEIYSKRDPTKWRSVPVLDVLERTFSGIIPLKVAKVPGSLSSLFENNEPLIVYIRPSSEQLDTYSKSMIVLIEIREFEVPFYISSLLEQFLKRWEWTSKIVYLLAANIIVSRADTLNISDLTAQEVVFDLTERVHSYRFNQLDVDNLSMGDLGIVISS